MGIKTVPQPPSSPDLAPCDVWLFPKLRGCRYETIEGMKEAVTKSHWHAHTRGLPWCLWEVVGTVQHVDCSRRRLLRRGLEFHVCTINKSAHTKKVRILVHSTQTRTLIKYYQTLRPTQVHSNENFFLEFYLFGWLVGFYETRKNHLFLAFTGLNGFLERSHHSADHVKSYLFNCPDCIFQISLVANKHATVFILKMLSRS